MSDDTAREVNPFTMFGGGKPRQQGNVKDFTPIRAEDRPSFPAPSGPNAPVADEQEGDEDDSPPATAPESTDGDGGEDAEREPTDDDLAWLAEDAPEL